MTVLSCLLPEDSTGEILKKYIAYHERCVDHIHKEFSFVIFNKQKNTYFAARDPIGLKPLYYTKLNNRYFFARDIGSLFKQSGIKKSLNKRTMEIMVCHSTVPYTETLFKGIQRLPPGHYMSVDAKGNATIHRYWRPETIEINYTITEDEAVVRFQELLDQAIAERIDDPAVTACELSGGLDSSSILSWIKSKQHPDKKMTALSMTFDSLDGCNETSYIELVNRRYDINLVKLPTDTLDYARQFNLEYNYRLNPYWPIFITYTMGFPLVEKAQSMGLKTVLTGQGGDYLMSGNYYCLHDYFKQFRWNTLLTELTASENPMQLIKYAVLLPFLDERVKKIIKSILHPIREKKNRPSTPNNLPFKIFADYYLGKSVSFQCDLAQLVHPTTSTLFENSYYHVAETMFGVEFRHPFFDRKLMEFILSLPPYYKLNKGRSKYLLRKAMQGILPEKIRLRTDKARFNEVLCQQINCINLDELLDDACIAGMGLVQQSQINEMKIQYTKGKHHKIIKFWQLINLEYWYRYNFTNDFPAHLIHEN